MQCGRPCCINLKSKGCSNCLKEGYCSPECQKKDWKVHKLMCPHLKNSTKQLPSKELCATLDKLSGLCLLELEKEGGENALRISEFCFTFTEQQFGDRILGQWYREREDGSRLDDWIVDIQYLQHFSDLIANNLKMISNNVDNVKIREDTLKKAICYYKRGLSILEPWGIQYTLEKSKRNYKLDEEKINAIYQKLSETETNLCSCLSIFGNYSEAIEYCDKAILHANIIMVEEIRIHIVFHAMTQKGKVLCLQKKFSEAKIVYEDAYNLVAEAYYVDHPLVLKAGNSLIDILIQTYEYVLAERYARISYESLTRPIDNESVEVGNAAELLSYVSYLICSTDEGDNDDDDEVCLKKITLKEAEMLGRKALRIKERIHGKNYYVDVNIKLNLSNILQLKGNHNDEARDLLEECLATNIARFGGNNRDVGVVFDRLATFHSNVAQGLSHSHAKTANLNLAIGYGKLGLRIKT